MDRYEWCGVEPGSEVKNVSGRGRKKDVKALQDELYRSCRKDRKDRGP